MIATKAVTTFLTTIRHTLVQGANFVQPRASWITFILLFGMLFALDTSVERADWVPVPRLGWITLQSMFLASCLASIRKVNVLFLHLTGLIVSILLLQRIGTSLITNTTSNALTELLTRVSGWIDVATTGGISNDPLPLTLWIITTSWIIGYGSAWSIIRHRNIWAGILPSAIALITTLSYLPESFSFYFFMYITFTILLLGWLHGLRAPSSLQPLSSHQVISVSTVNFGHAIWVALILVFTASLLPVTTVLVDPLRRGYDQVHQPIETIQEQFNRLFAGISGKKSTPFQSFGKTLPFKGPISFQGVVIFTATQSQPTYWGAQTYSEYTPTGWIASDSKKIPAGDKSPPPFTSYSSLSSQDHVVHLNFSTTTLFMPGIPTNSDRPSFLIVAEHAPFKIDLTATAESIASLPKDIRLWANHLIELTSTPSYKTLNPTALSDLFRQSLPPDIIIKSASFISAEGTSTLFANQVRTEANLDADAKFKRMILTKILDTPHHLSTISLHRVPPASPDVIAFRSTKRMSAGDEYLISGNRSIASEASLRAQIGQIPSWVTDQYLQVPASMPERIHLLAKELTVHATNQYDKVVALQSFLRRFEYSRDREKHPHKSDAVDHFVFEGRLGYCDDFASSLAVMARTLGIPSRVVAGYGPGILGPGENHTIIQDEDSHVWVEIFFPKYGWITFEPTPKYPLPSRSSNAPSSDRFSNESDSPNDMNELSGDEELFDQGSMALAGNFTDVNNDSSGITFRVAVLFSSVIGIVIAVMLGATWMRIMRSLGDPNRTYSLMSTLGRLVGVKLLPSMTPFEYARALTKVIPSADRQIQAVATEYVLVKYAKPTRATSNSSILDNALKQIQLAILTRLLKFGSQKDQQLP